MESRTPCYLDDQDDDGGMGSTPEPSSPLAPSSELVTSPTSAFATKLVVEEVLSFLTFREILAFREVCKKWTTWAPYGVEASTRRIASLRDDRRQRRLMLFPFPEASSDGFDEGSGGSEDDDEEIFFSRLSREPANVIRGKDRRIRGFALEDSKLPRAFVDGFIWYRLIPLLGMVVLLAAPALIPWFAAKSADGPQRAAQLLEEQQCAAHPDVVEPVLMSWGPVHITYPVLLSTTWLVGTLWVATYSFLWTWIQHTYPPSSFVMFIAFSTSVFFTSWFGTMALANDIRDKQVEHWECSTNVTLVSGDATTPTCGSAELLYASPWQGNPRFLGIFRVAFFAVTASIAGYSARHTAKYFRMISKVGREDHKRQRVLALISELTGGYGGCGRKS